jgi:hypothetical protein
MAVAGALPAATYFPRPSVIRGSSESSHCPARVRPTIETRGAELGSTGGGTFLRRMESKRAPRSKVLRDEEYGRLRAFAFRTSALPALRNGAPPARRVPASRAAVPYPEPRAQCPELRAVVNQSRKIPPRKIHLPEIRAPLMNGAPRSSSPSAAAGLIVLEKWRLASRRSAWYRSAVRTAASRLALAERRGSSESGFGAGSSPTACCSARDARGPE